MTRTHDYPKRFLQAFNRLVASKNSTADDVKQEGNSYEVTCPVDVFSGLREALEKAEITADVQQISRIPNSTVDLDSDTGRKVLKLMETLDDHDTKPSYPHARLQVRDRAASCLPLLRNRHRRPEPPFRAELRERHRRSSARRHRRSAARRPGRARTAWPRRAAAKPARRAMSFCLPKRLESLRPPPSRSLWLQYMTRG